MRATQKHYLLDDLLPGVQYYTKEEVERAERQQAFENRRAVAPQNHPVLVRESESHHDSGLGGQYSETRDNKEETTADTGKEYRSFDNVASEGFDDRPESISESSHIVKGRRDNNGDAKRSWQFKVASTKEADKSVGVYPDGTTITVNNGTAILEELFGAMITQKHDEIITGVINLSKYSTDCYGKWWAIDPTRATRLSKKCGLKLYEKKKNEELLVSNFIRWLESEAEQVNSDSTIGFAMVPSHAGDFGRELYRMLDEQRAPTDSKTLRLAMFHGRSTSTPYGFISMLSRSRSSFRRADVDLRKAEHMNVLWASRILLRRGGEIPIQGREERLKHMTLLLAMYDQTLENKQGCRNNDVVAGTMNMSSYSEGECDLGKVNFDRPWWTRVSRDKQAAKCQLDFYQKKASFSVFDFLQWATTRVKHGQDPIFCFVMLPLNIEMGIVHQFADHLLSTPDGQPIHIAVLRCPLNNLDVELSIISKYGTLDKNIRTARGFEFNIRRRSDFKFGDYTNDSERDADLEKMANEHWGSASALS